MPTAGKLTGAVLLAALGLWVTVLCLPNIPEGKTPPFFFPVNIIAGIWIGWVFLGSRVGAGFVAAFSFGLTAAALMLVVALFFHAGEEMLDRALAKRYGGAMEAVVSTFEIMIDMAVMIYSPKVAAALFGGGIAVAYITEFVGRRLP